MSEHFSQAELSCRCCGVMDMKEDFLDKLEDLRVAYGNPMILSSAYRCAKYNQRVSTTGAKGPHTTGRAVDVLTYGQDCLELVNLAHELGFTGFGIKQKGHHVQRFLHLDDLPEGVGQPRPWIWSY